MQQDAQRALPLSKLTQKGRELANRVLNDVTVFRRLPTQVIESDQEMYTFLVEHPDLVINIWEVMGLTKVVMQRIGPNSFRLNDGNGTSGDIHYLYRSPGHTIVYCEGTYTGSLMPRPIRGRCLLSLRSAGVRDADGTDLIQSRLDSFIQIDNLGVEVFAKTFAGVIGGIADHNFRETTGFVQGVHRAAAAAPENIHRIAQKLNRVTVDERKQFTDISDRIGSQATATAARPQVQTKK